MGIRLGTRNSPATPSVEQRTKLDRRKFVAGMGIATVGSVFALAPSGSVLGEELSSADVMAGAVETIGASGSVVVTLLRDRTRRIGVVIPETDATFWRDRPTDLSAFRASDEIVARGVMREGHFHATNIAILLHSAQGTVLSTEPERLATTSGVFELSQLTSVYDRSGQPADWGNLVMEGALVTILYRRDENEGSVACLLFVEQEGDA